MRDTTPPQPESAKPESAESLLAAARDALREARTGDQPVVPTQRDTRPAPDRTPGHRHEQRARAGKRGQRPNVTQPLRRRGG